MNQTLKETIKTHLFERGADLVGIARADTWAQRGVVPEPYRPSSLWPPVRSVIVIGIQMPLPIVETTPSVQHRDLYNTCNRKLDSLAFDAARWLMRQGHAALSISRDGYATIHVLIKNPRAAFSHSFAAQYAGLGHVGINNTILTREFGPRVRFVSVFTGAMLPPDPAAEENLCIRCGACADMCPTDALIIDKKSLRDGVVLVAEYDKRACAEWARKLTKRGCYPCGICIKVCPVGEDRILYGRLKKTGHYRRELTTPVFDTTDPLYASWNHIRRHGSSLIDESVTDATTLEEVFQKIRDDE
jgi:epoxyqueuosine reductase